MSWLVTGKQYIPTVIGEEFGGGYFAGYISHTADGNPTHALIVAPRATGATGTGYPLLTGGVALNLQWKTTNAITAGTTSSFDGAANTAVMVTAGIADHPAAEFCVNLNIGGYTDWYLPSLLELDIAYFNLKPDTTNNNTNAGTNIYAVPRRNSNYTAGYPSQTAFTAFNTSQGFATNLHWTSQESATPDTYGRLFNFINGTQDQYFKTTAYRVRAFRRIAL